jgi:hypothetical protein
MVCKIAKKDETVSGSGFVKQCMLDVAGCVLDVCWMCAGCVLDVAGCVLDVCWMWLEQFTWKIIQHMQT